MALRRKFIVIGIQEAGGGQVLLAQPVTPGALADLPVGTEFCADTTPDFVQADPSVRPAKTLYATAARWPR